MRKHSFRRSVVAVLFFGGIATAFAQQMPPLPTDPNVRIGKLENGLTYYIRHNELPENQADFYIAQKVGSILEEDNQRGLAHFLEHMCFNGTKNFPGTALRDWLETIGVKFGANLNAYTSVDETVYNISNVPVIRDGIVDSCLLILHDWADGLTLDPKEIDKERGVIHEEYRSHDAYVRENIPNPVQGQQIRLSSAHRNHGSGRQFPTPGTSGLLREMVSSGPAGNHCSR